MKIGEVFTFKAGEIVCVGRRPRRQLKGYRAFNSNGEEVGLVYMTDDERTASYGCCELFFYNDYKGKVWCRFTSHGQKLKWEKLQQYLLTNNEYKCYID